MVYFLTDCRGMHVAVFYRIKDNQKIVHKRVSFLLPTGDGWWRRDLHPGVGSASRWGLHIRGLYLWGLPSGGSASPQALQDTVNKRAVRILLECILVALVPGNNHKLRFFPAFSEGKTASLRVKWVQEPKYMCLEGKYVTCLEEKLPYKLKYNKRRGDTCPCNN